MSGGGAPAESGKPTRESEEVAGASRLARFFFLKTTFGILITALFTVGGILSYGLLVKEALPDLEIPQATVTTQWPGADPATIEEQVTQEIEDELTTLGNLKALNSASFDSYSVISVEFNADADAGEAIQDLRSAVADAEANLPAEAEAPTIDQVSVDDRPVLTLALYGDADISVLSEQAEDLQDRLERVSGVNEVELSGARDEIVQVLLDPSRLLALGLSPVQVSAAIQRANLEQPFGEIESEEIGAVVRLEGQFRDVAELESLPVARFGQGATGRAVLLGEVATVRRQLENEDSRAFYSSDGEEFRHSIDLSVKKVPGADTIAVIENVLAEMEAAASETSWPEGVAYDVIQNEADKISENLSDVLINGLQAMGAVFLVLFIVLSWREGLIAGLSIPVSFCGVLMVILLMGYSLNELVIIGMVLALGLLVDVFILMMEGLHEGIYQRGKTFGQAALSTVRRYAIPAFAGQLTTVLALVPLMAIGGVSGKFIRVLPITTIACLVLAYAVALFATVPLSRFLLERAARDDHSGDEKSRSDHVAERAARGLEAWLERHVLASRRKAWQWVGSAGAAFMLSLAAVSQVPLVLYPETDGETLGINIELPPDTQLETAQDVADEVGAMLRDKPYFKSIVMLAGRKSPFASASVAASLQPSQSENFVGFSAIFVDRGERDRPSYAIAEALRAELSAYLQDEVAGASLLVVPETNQPTSGDPIEIEITGPDMDELQDLSEQVQEHLESVEGVVDVRDNLGSVKRQIALRPDREALDFYGLTQEDLAAQIRFGLSNDKIGEFSTVGPEDDLDIRMGTNWPSRSGQAGSPERIEELSQIRAFTSQGETVSVLSLLRPVQSQAPIAISHVDGQRALTVLAKNEGRAVTEIVQAMRPQLEEMAADWPAGYGFTIAGEAEETNETFGSAGIALAVALILVFGVLVIVFDSFPQAFILLTTMPLALIGTFFGFFLFGLSLSFFAVIGVISLIGIVANNGIVMVDNMNERLAEGRTIPEAAALGAGERLRPILTTSVTTIVGLIPLALGNPMYAPLCLAIIFGLFSSTVLSLVIIPALYLLLTRKSRTAGSTLD